ncbi:MAG: GAF domain-containing sensor histidine kinase [Anaerolineales bacterium]|nr:GAF domain-containing sensor histidine kinase [Anaerolineales bacterium]
MAFQKNKKEIDRRRRAGYDITKEVIQTNQRVYIPDMSTDPRFEGIWENLKGRSYLKLPLISRGTLVGVLGIVAPPNQSISSRSVEFLKVIGNVFGIAIDNALLFAHTIRGEQRAQSLYQLGLKVTSSLTVNSVLENVAESSRELMEADIGLVVLVDTESNQMVMEAIAGRVTDLIPRFHKISKNHLPWQELITGQPLIYNRQSSHQHQLYTNQFLEKEDVQSYLAVPLMQRSVFLGLLVLMYRHPQHFTQSDINTVFRLTHQIVLSVENAQLYHQLHHLAVFEERDRLSRKLHDDLSQTLGYLKIKASMTEDLLENGNLAKASDSLKQVKKVCEVLYTNVREEIFNLRTHVQEQQGFFNALREYLSKYRTHYGLEVDLMVEKECLLNITPQVSCQLMPIIQEALSNVRKHSQASKVYLYCSQKDDRICILIEDNGDGFHPSQVVESGENFGIQIMRERAESIGGSLSLKSKPGQGTKVIINTPMKIQN